MQRKAAGDPTATCRRKIMNPQNLIEKYRPSTLSEVAGQPYLVSQLQMFAESPYSAVFLFEGYTGTGKSSAAMALANDLGIKVDRGVFSGLWQIASGEQTGDTVQKTMENLRVTPMEGSGWRMLIVNECDIMTAGAAAKWLDALENLPPRTVVIFTTNNGHKLQQRFRDRCECFAFESSTEAITPYLQEIVDRVWKGETGQADAPRVADFGPLADEQGHISFRRLLQAMTPWLRSGKRPAGAKPIPAQSESASLTRETIGRLWTAGKRVHKEVIALGVPWIKLRRELIEMGFQPPRRVAV
jgi:DNA polymerase III, delta subunit